MDHQNSILVPVSPALHDASAEPATRAAADRIAPEMAALADHEVDTVNVDIAAAVARVFSVWSTVQGYIPAIDRLDGVDASRVAKLQDYARNLIFWQGSATYAPAVEGLTLLAEKGMTLRDRTIGDLAQLASHGVMEGASLANFRGTKSHRKLGQDLIALANLVHERWDVIRGRSMITLESADEAMRLGEDILKAVGDRELTPASVAQAIVQRDKAYTLFARAYDEARRALLFLRWHEGDADSILPSMYGSRRSAKKRDAEPAPAVTPASAASVTSAPAKVSSLLVAEDEV
jgi:hypothetical protein